MKTNLRNMRKLFFMLFLVAFAAWNSYGQETTYYAFAQSNGTYNEITGTDILGNPFDDQTAVVSLGFTHLGNGWSKDQIRVSANGWLYFPNTSTSSLGYTPISSSITGIYLVVAPFGRDLRSIDATSSVSYLLSGVAPNRVFTVQWKNVKRYGSAYAGEILNLQVKIYETTSKIEMIYGPCTAITGTNYPQVGLRGLTNTDFSNRTSTTGWNNTVAGTVNTETVTTNATYPPINGLTFTYTYTFLPPAAATIVSPANGETDVPRQTTLNWGNGGSGGGPFTGYTLYLGTDNPPTNLVNGLDMGSATTYDPVPDLLATTTYYWRVDSYGPGGNTTGTVWSFTTLTPTIISGWVRNSALNPIIGASVYAGAYNTMTGAGGAYELELIPGTYDMIVTAPGYNSATATGIVVPPASNVTQNFTLTNPTMSITPNPFNVTVNPNELYTENMYILNEGTGQLDWSATIAFPPGDNAMGGGIQPPLLSPGTGGVETTRAGFANDPVDPNNSDAAGDILSSFVIPNPPISLGWGLGVEGNNLWMSSYNDKKLYKFSPSGSIITSFDYSSWAGANWVGDLAPGPAGYIYAVRVGTDNAIHKINTGTGADEGMITGAWATTSARGVAYDAVHNELWVGGWNHSQIYHVSATGATISTISFSGVAGLGWHKAGNGGTGSLWVVTNASPSVVYELNPATGAILKSFVVPGVSGYTGAGLEIDAQGNVWLINQTNQTVYKIDSGTPIVSWLTLEEYSGTVPPMTNYALPAHFNAFGLLAGTVKTATITFTSSPDVGTWNIPVTMTVQGTPLETPQNLAATLVNQLTGEVSLTWDAVDPTGLLYYAINRDGVQLTTTSYNYYTDMLPTYGTYSYTVQAVYSAGLGVPSNPAEVEWPNPTLTLDPASLTATVWTGTDKDVPFTVGNIGEGTLAYEFPDYTDDDAPLAYCAASASYCDEYISRVQFNTIDNSTGCSYYANYTSISTDVKAGDTYPVTVTNPVPYSSDQAALWIDYNHNEVFDNDESYPLTQGGGGATFTGNILIKETSLPGPTRMRIRLSYAATPAPCGTQTYGEVEDYTVNVIQNFITQVIPAQGTVAGGDDTEVVATFSATGSFAPAGTYTQSLLLTTNDLAHPSVTIPCTMIVTIPGTISGTVTDCITGEPIQGVMVAADPFTVMTDENGNYSLVCDENTYNVVFSKIGYQSNTITGVAVTSGATTTVNAQLCEMPYAPGCANAVVNATDTQCDVTWCVPMGPYELSYDDGTAENFAAWQLAGNLNAVKFTPAGYPATVIGGMFYVGDGTFPAGGNIINSTFTVRVFDDDGATGLPGTQIGDSVLATVTATGWVTVTGLNATVTAGSFYLAMEQNEAEPNCAPIGVDETLPKAYKSYSKFVTSGGEWALSAYQDFMIHAIVDGPVADDDAVASTQVLVPAKASLAGVISQRAPYTLPGVEGKAVITSPEGYVPDAITNYILYRYPVTDPSIPVYGTEALLADDLTTNSYVDGGSVWSALPQGWYAYGVKAVYPNGQESPITYTNIVGHKMTADVTINVQLVCGFVPAVGAEVQMIGLDYPYQTFSATTPASGSVTFNVWKGNYTVDVRTTGYLPYVVNYNITGPTPIDVILEDAKYAPRNLYVDANTLVATWEPPLLALVDENFEGATFPPSGWSETGNATVGWFATTAGGSSYFPVPSHTKYAIVNDDDNDEDNCCTYLITPNLDLSTAPGFVMNFDSYFTGAWGGTATVELTTDGGATWTTIYTVPAAGSWGTKTIDLSAYSGPGGLTSAKIGFHYNDNGSWADGWAIDNVNVTVGMTPTYGYGVFLDGSLAGNTNELTWTYNPSAMLWGHTYVAGVAGLYCSGYSDMATYTFTSNFLFPPRNLQGLANDNAAILTWEPPVSGDGMDNAGTKPDYSWMQSNGGTLSTTGNPGNAAPGDGFTAKANRAETEIYYCGEKDDAIGTGGAVEFMVAARFTNDELYQYYGLKQITKVSMFCSNSG
ncbi:MAG TPA: carboxypeptidase regulatory-like domain-containing protein, partial [Bacteroidales bacterium]|nr:carboxypeptidase regulatory-like domain-containing protein [Bacteroidales bacterium]